MASVARRRSSASARGPTRSWQRWRYPCSATTWPAPAISAASAGCRSTCSPTRKNVAVAPRVASASSTAGVPGGGGPPPKGGGRGGGGGALRVRAVVEGEVHGGGGGAQAPVHAQALGHAGDERRERRRAPARRCERRERRPRPGPHASILPMGTADIAAGLVCGIAAAACFELGYVIQAGDARAAGEHAGSGLLLRLARRRAWLGGTALVVCGLALQLLALYLAPLSVVHPALVLGLGL